ncbi:MAG: dipeptidase [Bryobacteraceae bacterium]|nr:dipeptidase [Bryobacteraceae bacterium]MDW8379994.1 dipeptidase [Bryobacterales bacterium]
MSYFREHRSRFLEELKAFLRIPSISASAEHSRDIERAAEFVATELRQAGLKAVQVISGPGHPLVYGEWLEAPGKPVLLFYGHYDVQPPEPLEEWISPPFEPEIRGENLYARGAADDKGLLMILIKALEGVMAVRGRLPVNVRFLVEGEEESGGEHLAEFVASQADGLKAHAAVICDTEMFAPELPTLCVGLRGILYGELRVQGAAQDLHSGVYGGAVPNPLMALAEILCELKDRDGRLQIPGYLDRVRPPAPEELAAWSRLPFDERRYLEQEVRAKELTGEPGYSLLERLWARPTLEVHGIRGGFTGEGAKTVIPAKAVAKLSSRLVADQDPQECAQLLEQAIRKATPRGVTAEFHLLHAAAPSLTDPSHPLVQAAARALEEVFGNPAVYVRSGGSIPVVSLFDRYLRIPSVMMGFGLPDDNLHAPNEKLYLPNFYRGIEAVARYLDLAAEVV